MALEKLKSLFTKQPATPQYSLTDADKLYLAVAVKHTGKLSFVYTLSCKRDKNGNYLPFDTTTKVETFTRRRDAEIAHATTQQMIAAQKSFQGVPAIHGVHEALILKFMENTK